MRSAAFDPGSDRDRRALVAACIGCAVVLCVAALRAWVCDDAYITFRVVDNVVHGHGLRWNVDERVQVFTHPLWMLLHVPPYAVFGNIYLVTIVLSLVMTGAALWIAARALPTPHWALPALLAAALLGSRAFMDYTTSGLEAPLSFLLFAVFAERLVRPGVHWGALIWVASLAVLNRFDSVVLYLPVLACLFVRGPRPSPRDFVGAVPLAAWSAFALAYYGFVFPNTKPAKLSTGIETTRYLQQGWLYLRDLALNDPASLVLIVVGVLLGLLGLLGPRPGAAGGRGRPPGERPAAAVAEQGRLALLAIGVVAYVGYVVYVGGDFMRGRYFSVPVFAGAWIAARSADALPRRERLLCIGAVAASIALSALPPRTVASYVGDQRALYAGRFSLLSRAGDGSLFLRTGLADHPYLAEHEDFLARRECDAALVVRGAIGIYGFHAGPDVIVIDDYALSDALLARLPWHPREEATFALKGLPIGHFARAKPDGYVESRLTGEEARLDPALTDYHRRLRLVTSAPLLSASRLRAIAELNLGRGDAELERYVADRYAAAQETPSGRRTWCPADVG